MQFTYDGKIIEKLLYSFKEERTFDIRKTLGEKNYASPFNILNNRVLVSLFEINKFKLTLDIYIHLFEKEKFDEN